MTPVKAAVQPRAKVSSDMERCASSTRHDALIFSHSALRRDPDEVCDGLVRALCHSSTRILSVGDCQRYAPSVTESVRDFEAPLVVSTRDFHQSTRTPRTNTCTIMLAVLSTRDALQNKPWSWVECRVNKEVGPSLCISRLPKPTLASCCRGHHFCARETHHRCDPPAHSIILSLSHAQALAVEQPVQDSDLQVPRRYPAGVVHAFMFTLTAEHGRQHYIRTRACT